MWNLDHLDQERRKRTESAGSSVTAGVYAGDQGEILCVERYYGQDGYEVLRRLDLDGHEVSRTEHSFGK